MSKITSSQLLLSVLIMVGIAQTVAAVFYVGMAWWSETVPQMLWRSVQFSSAFLAPLLMLLFSRRPGARIVILYITVLSMIGFASWIYADLIVLHPDRKGLFFIAVNIYQWFFAMLGVLLYAMAGLPQSWRRWVMYGYDPMAHRKNLR